MRTMNSTMVRGVKNCPISPRKVRPKESLEGDALDVLAGVGKVVAFQQLDDFPACGGLQPDFFISSKILSSS